MLAYASAGEDSITVWADGTVSCSLRTYYLSDVVSEGEPRRSLRTTRHVEGRVPIATQDRIRAAVAKAQVRGTSLTLRELADLARVPHWVGNTVSMALSSPPSWATRHQEPDGSWSPTDFDWNCRSEKRCSGPGQETFRVAATALMTLCSLNAGYSREEELAGLRFLMGRQQQNGGFADPGDPSPEMTNACAAIALSRGVTMSGQR